MFSVLGRPPYAWLTFGALVGILVCETPAAAQQSSNIVWVNGINVSLDATGTIVQKTGGCDGCGDAGAVSQQELTAGDAYVEFTVREATTFWIGGLTQGDGTGYYEIDFAFRFNGGGWADILENGAYAGGDTPYAAGDVFRIAVVNGRVQYSRNGTFLRESNHTPQYPLVLDLAFGSMGASVGHARLGFFPPPPSGGGLLETAGSPALRPRLTRTQIESFLPPAGTTGRFTFPAPYNTDAVRLTNAGTCGGSDCLWDAGYSYWRNINNHVGSTDMYVFLGTDISRGGRGPILIRYNKATDAVDDLGPLFPENSGYRYSTGEGWYFSATQPTKLYTLVVGSTALRRFDIMTREFDPLPALDLAACVQLGSCPADAAFITQAHSSDDDLVHSATVQNGNWQRIGCVAAAGATYTYFPTPAGYSFDECHVDKSGRWLVMLESRPDWSRINRVVDLTTGLSTTIEASQGALGHLDMGHGYAVGADTYSWSPNATILLKFPIASTTRPVGPDVHFNKRWDLAAANHVAHGNAIAGLAPEDQYACGSNASRVADMADEIVCFPLDPARNAGGGLDVLVVGQVLTDLNAAGGGNEDYTKTPKGNLDVTGRYFFWTTNLGGDRLDAVIVKIPAERLAPQ